MSPKINNDMLISLMRSHPYLYDTSHPKYKDLQLKDKTWLAICARLKIREVTNIKTRWRSLRDRYTREKLHFIKRSISSNGKIETQPPKWRLYRVLEALIDPTSEMKSTTSVDLNGVSEKLELIDPSNNSVTSELELEEVSNPSASQLSNAIGLNEILVDNPTDLRDRQTYQTPSEDSVNRKKLKLDENANKALSLMQDVCCNLLRAQETSVAIVNKFTEKNDDAHYYGQCLISRFRTLPRHKFIEARIAIEKIMYQIESEVQNQN